MKLVENNMQHNQRFVTLVKNKLGIVSEIQAQTVKKMLDESQKFYLIDVREDSEWNAGYLPQAIHISKGLIESKIENVIPDINATIILYCGGGYRSALAAFNLIEMGYKNVKSMAGGFRSWRESGFNIEG